MLITCCLFAYRKASSSNAEASPLASVAAVALLSQTFASRSKAASMDSAKAQVFAAVAYATIPTGQETADGRFMGDNGPIVGGHVVVVLFRAAF